MIKFKKVLSIGISESNLEQKYWERIDKVSEKRVMLAADSSELNGQLSDADCLLINPFVFKAGREIIDAAPELKFIGVLATGYGAIDVAHAAKRGIAVCNIPGYATESVAELAIAVLLEYTRNIVHARQMAKAGNYSDTPGFPVYELKGKTLGILGAGRIGSRVAELAIAFGLRVLYWSRNKNPRLESKGAEYCEVESLLPECNAISLHLALNKDTEMFLDEQRIIKIRQGAVLINLSPNELVDFHALEKRLAKGHLVYIADHTDEMSPGQIRQLSRYEGFIPYPPIGYQTIEAAALKQEIFVGNMENFLGGSPTNKVD